MAGCPNVPQRAGWKDKMQITVKNERFYILSHKSIIHKNRQVCGFAHTYLYTGTTEQYFRLLRDPICFQYSTGTRTYREQPLMLKVKVKPSEQLLFPQHPCSRSAPFSLYSPRGRTQPSNHTWIVRSFSSNWELHGAPGHIPAFLMESSDLYSSHNKLIRSFQKLWLEKAVFIFHSRKYTSRSSS